MKRRSFLLTTLISTLLLSGTITANPYKCKNGKCYIDISKFSKSKSVNHKIKNFKKFSKLRFSSKAPKALSKADDLIVLDHSKYIMSDYEKEHYFSENSAFYDEEDTIVLLHSKYIMSESEKEAYLKQQKLEEEKNEIIEPVVTLDEKIEEIILPHSELFCDSDKVAKFHPDTNEYECA
jgi:hypothetical protein